MSITSKIGNTSIVDFGQTLTAAIVNRIPDYSSTEQYTGQKWINGKKIYRKTVSFGANTSNPATDYVHNIPNVDLIWIDHQNSFVYIPAVPMTCSGIGLTTSSTINLDTIASIYSVSRTIISCGFGPTRRSGNVTAYVTVMYTKLS